ncbi:MAG: hypothetical protein JWO48_698, partial [Bryobacterales bacterium]|nr:hypothetical protein [Bryobacterales bacterium]
MVTVSETIVPEPATWSMLAAAALLACLWKFRRALAGNKRLALPLLLFFVFIFAPVPGHSQASPIVFVTGPPGVNLEDSTTLLAAIRLRNIGTVAAQNVTVQSITLNGATRTAPNLPFNLGSVGLAGGETTLQTTFTGTIFSPGGKYRISVSGTYAV